MGKLRSRHSRHFKKKQHTRHFKKKQHTRHYRKKHDTKRRVGRKRHKSRRRHRKRSHHNKRGGSGEKEKALKERLSEVLYQAKIYGDTPESSIDKMEAAKLYHKAHIIEEARIALLQQKVQDYYTKTREVDAPRHLVDASEKHYALSSRYAAMARDLKEKAQTQAVKEGDKQQQETINKMARSIY